MRICVLSGDGIGPEIMAPALKLLTSVCTHYDLPLTLQMGIIGGASYDQFGHPLTEDILQMACDADAVLMDTIGGPKWDHLKGHFRPESALLSLRKALQTHANIRPVKLFDALKNHCPLDLSKHNNPLDFIIVRELISDVYYGDHVIKGIGKDRHAYDVMQYTYQEIETIAHTAFELAMKRSKRLTSIDKANVLSCSQLWRETINAVSKDYPEVDVTHMLVDNAAMQLILNPYQFDVMVTPNMFGDILSDEASVLTGSIGTMGSMSLSTNGRALYEPIHGSAPDIAGKGIANPIGMIQCIALLFQHTYGRPDIAISITKAIEDVLAQGVLTQDLILTYGKAATTQGFGLHVLSTWLKNTCRVPPTFNKAIT